MFQIMTVSKRKRIGLIAPLIPVKKRPRLKIARQRIFLVAQVDKINGHETIMDIVGSGLTYKEAKNLILVLKLKFFLFVFGLS